MTLALIAVCAAGLFIGARFLAPVILFATLLVVMMSILTGVFLGSPLKLILLRTFYLIIALQGCYLIGLGLTALAPRGKSAKPEAGFRKRDRTSSPRRPSG